MTQERVGREQAAELGRALARHRADRKISQREFAARVYYDRTSIAHIEAGRQSAPRTFWSRADAVLDACGALLGSFARASADVTRPKLGLGPSGVESGEGVQLVLRLLDVAGPATALDALGHLVSDQVARYEQEGPHRLAGEVGQLLHVGQHIRTCRTTRADSTRLAGLTGRLSGLLAYMAVNRSGSTCRPPTASKLPRARPSPWIATWPRGSREPRASPPTTGIATPKLSNTPAKANAWPPAPASASGYWSTGRPERWRNSATPGVPSARSTSPSTRSTGRMCQAV